MKGIGAGIGAGAEAEAVAKKQAQEQWQEKGRRQTKAGKGVKGSFEQSIVRAFSYCS